jgi:NDP-sugar pyrophosphorylase family protein
LNPPYKITYLTESKSMGTAGGLSGLGTRLNGPFFVVNCDIIIDADYNEIASFHADSRNDITLVASMRQFKIPYGVCEIRNGGELVRIHEKPEYSFLINAGMYILNPPVVALIPSDEPSDMTNLIERAQKDGMKVGVFPVGEKAWIDIGEWAEYKKALSLVSKDKTLSE